MCSPYKRSVLATPAGQDNVRKHNGRLPNALSGDRILTGDGARRIGDLIIGAHGSWNRAPATGRVIARARLSGTTITGLDILVGEKDSAGQLLQGTWNVRPVDVRQGPDDAVYVSDDMGGRVLKIGYAN